MKTIIVSPSDINYMFDRCPRCWYRKVNKIQKPKEVLPKVFNNIDAGMKEAYDLEIIQGLGIHATSIVSIETVRSRPISFPEYGVDLVISGKLDKAVMLEDGTLAIVEFKTAEFDEWKVKGFSRQTHAYEMALRIPEKGQAREVSEIHLVFFQPYHKKTFRVKTIGVGRVIGSLLGDLIHREIELDRGAFDKFLEGMAKVAGSSTLPNPGRHCDFCQCVVLAGEFDRRIA